MGFQKNTTKQGRKPFTPEQKLARSAMSTKMWADMSPAKKSRRRLQLKKRWMQKKENMVSHKQLLQQGAIEI